MFGFGLKKRTAEAIRRGVRASLTGAYFHHSDVRKFALNDDASAWLYTEALAHHLYALGIITAMACKNDSWATFDFFVESALVGMREAERAGEAMETEKLAQILLKRYAEFQRLGGDARLDGKHYESSALLVARRDKSADVEALTSALSHSTDRYMKDVGRMFDV